MARITETGGGNVRVRETREVSVKVSTVDYGKVIVNLVLVAVGLVLAYLLVAYVLLPLLGGIVLLALGVLSVYFLLNPSKELGPTDPSQTKFAVIYERMKQTNPDLTEEKAYTWICVGLWAIVAIYGVMTAVVMAYAMSGAYQRFPINLIGFATFFCMLAWLVLCTTEVATIKRWKTEPARRASWGRRYFGKLSLLLNIVFVGCIFAVKFGVP